jgi:hypothetical protein
VQKVLNQRALWWLPFIAAAYRFCHVSILKSGAVDLHVYWQAIQLWLSGVSPYAFQTAHDAILIYKYPPWTLPFFLPLAVGGFEFWHWMWSLLQIAGILYCVRWVVRTGASLHAAAITGFLFWWIWLGHAQAGQISVFVLALALWTVSPDKSIRPARAAFLSLVMPMKVFNVFSLLGILRDLLKPRPILYGILGLIGLNAIVFAVLHAHGNPVGIRELYQEWMKAAASAGTSFDAGTIRGPGNHGFTALVLRLMHVPDADSSKDIWVALGLGCVLSAAWAFFSRTLSREEKWAGWLAVGTVIHPLLWHHGLVMVYPLCALALDRSLRAKDAVTIALSLIGIFLIGILIPNIISPEIVYPFELAASKSWGVTLAAVALVRAKALLPKTALPTISSR